MRTPRIMVYLTYSQRLARSLTVVGRTSIPRGRTALALQTARRDVDPDLWVFETETMHRHLALMRLPQRLSASCSRSACWDGAGRGRASTAW